MDDEKIRIDWREQFDKLATYIDGKGGIVSISYNGEPCASNAFVATLRSSHNAINNNAVAPKSFSPGHTIIISKENYATRYMSELRGEFEQCLGIKLPLVEKINDRFRSTIASNNSAQGNQTIETHIHYGDESEIGRSIERDKWVGDLCTQLERILKDRRVMLILTHGACDEQNVFWNKFWDKGIKKLVAHGLVLIRMQDTSDSSQQNRSKFIRSDCYLNLPSHLDPIQQKIAQDDIAKWIKKELNIDSILANAYALSFVQAQMNEINRLHDCVGFWLEGMRNNQ